MFLLIVIVCRFVGYYCRKEWEKNNENNYFKVYMN